MPTELFRVTIEDRLTPALNAKIEALKPENLGKVVGRVVSEQVRTHLYAYDRAHPNKLGGKRTHLFGKAADSVTFTSDSKGAVITASQLGLRQRYFGGPISPKNRTYLTFPVVAEAYGKSPREFPNLIVIFGKNRQPIGLGEKGAKGQPNKMMFFMTKKTIQQDGDVATLPSPAQIADSAVASIKETVALA